MKQNSIYSDAWCNLVFEGRNQKYGAFRMRRDAEYYTLSAFLISTLLVLLSLFIPLILRPASDLDHRLSELMDEIHLVDMDLHPVPLPEALKKAGTVKPAVKQEKATVPVIRDHIDPIPNMEMKKLNTGPFGKDPSNGGNPLSLNPVEANVTEGDTSAEDNRIYFNAGLEVGPEFPGGEKAMMDFLKNNIHYPAEAYRNGTSGTVYISFVINKSGAVSDVVVLRGVEHEPTLETEAVRVINLFPGWKPGFQNGKPVSVRYMIPVNFILKDNF